MAPKSAKPKTSSLALVVLTPTMGKGLKRISKDDSNKDKGKKKKKKKGESSSALALERNVQYFYENKTQERYNIDFSF